MLLQLKLYVELASLIVLNNFRLEGVKGHKGWIRFQPPNSSTGFKMQDDVRSGVHRKHVTPLSLHWTLS